MTHKLTSYILKNPPNEVAKTSKSKSSKAERRAAKQSKGGKEEEEGGSNEGEEEAEAAPPSPPPAEPVKVKKSKKDKHEREDDDWSADTSAEAVRQRAEDLNAGVATLATNDDLERSTTERLEIFFEFVKVRMGPAKLPTKEIVAEAERLDCKDKAVMALVELLLDSESEVLARAKANAGLFQRFVVGNAKAQKYLLGALEKLAERYSKVADKFANILKGLYDLDILEEEAIIEWGAKVSKKYVSKELSTKLHENAEPFIAWLKEAEEEDDSDDDDDDATGVAVTFTSAASEALSVVKPEPSSAAEAASPAAAEDDEDIDIDAI